MVCTNISRTFKLRGLYQFVHKVKAIFIANKAGET
jgi:hypothetical protein